MTQRWIDLATAAEILGVSEEAVFMLGRDWLRVRSIPGPRDGFDRLEAVYDARAVEELAKIRAQCQQS